MVLYSAESIKKDVVENAMRKYFLHISPDHESYYPDPFERLEKLGIKKTAEIDKIILEYGVSNVEYEKLLDIYTKFKNFSKCSKEIKDKLIKTYEEALEELKNIYEMNIKKISDQVQMTFEPIIVDDELIDIILQLEYSSWHAHLKGMLKKGNFKPINEKAAEHAIAGLLQNIHFYYCNPELYPIKLEDLKNNKDLRNSIKNLNDVYKTKDFITTMYVDCSYEELTFNGDNENASTEDFGEGFDDEVIVTKRKA